MESILRGYSLNEPTWFYLSLLLIIAVFFRFNRVWSLRNLDLVLLLSISPGLLIVKVDEVLGYTWLFVGTVLFLLRLFCDPLFKRRPHLEQNLNPYGLVFLGAAAFAFLMTKVITERPPDSTHEIVGRANRLLNLEDASADSTAKKGSKQDIAPGPASPLIVAPVVPISKVVASSNASPSSSENDFRQVAARIMAILAHLAIVCGLVIMGRQHFGDVQVGIAMAALYLLLPGTAIDVGKVNHVLPAALIVWAFVAYRRPMAAGSLLGLASGTLFFPVFLLPLWASFYTKRGAIRFGLALGIVAAVLLGSLLLTSANTQSFVSQITGPFDWSAWVAWDYAYSIPVGAGFLVMLVVLTIWPRQKNLEHLLSHSAAIVIAVVVATQFWSPTQGGVYLLWYLPLLMMVVFRPRLAHLEPVQREADQTEETRNSTPTHPEPAVSTTLNGRQFR